jgi:hypothetical protein
MAWRNADNRRSLRWLRLGLTCARYTLAGRRFKLFRTTIIRERIFGQDYAKTRATWRKKFREANVGVRRVCVSDVELTSPHCKRLSLLLIAL